MDFVWTLIFGTKYCASSTSEKMISLSPEEQLEIILENTTEVLKEDIIRDVIFNQKRPLKVYWGAQSHYRTSPHTDIILGTATTGRPHAGYLVCMLKIAGLLAAGCNVKILLADVHGFLDNLKAPIELVEYRAKYYRFVITSLLKACGVSIDRLEVVLGSSYQLSKEYTMDQYKLSTMTTIHDAKKAGAEVVKQTDNPTLSGLIYPLMQALDEQYLEVDCQYGGVDQRKIFALAQEILPKIEYKPRAHLMTPMVPGLAGGKMSASDPDSKIDILDEPAKVERKLKKAHCIAKETEGNGVIAFVKFVLLPLSKLRTGKPQFIAGEHTYNEIETLKADYEDDELTPQVLKSGVSKALCDFLAPIQEEYRSNKEWQEIEALAYPVEQPVKKEKRKPKNKGTMYPGGSKANVTAQPDGHVEGPDKEQVEVGATPEEAIKKLQVNGAPS